MAKKKSQKSPEPKKTFFEKKKNRLLLVALFIVVLFITTAASFYLVFLDRIYPGIYIANVDVSALTKNETTRLVQDVIKKRQQNALNLTLTQQNNFNQNQKYILDLSQTLDEDDLQKSINQAFEYGHTKVYKPKVYLTISPNFTSSIDSQINGIALQVNQNPINSQLKVEEGQINVTPSQDGFVLDDNQLKQKITSLLNSGQLNDLSLPMKKVSPNLSYNTALEIKKRLDEIKLSPLQLTFKEQSFTMDLSTVISLIDLENSQPSLVSTTVGSNPINISSITINDKEFTDTKLALNTQKVNEYLKTLSIQINRDVREPLFEFDPNSVEWQSRIREFQPPQEGRRLNIIKSAQALNTALITPNQKTVELQVDTIQPRNKLTNDLGIKELIGSGNSSFSGSIENRIYNIGHGASKINGVMIAPGETFSFNNTVGDITAATGFKQAYVIKSGRTVLDDGGGICQVSTTLYRAILNAGLPIVQRTAHAYRVSYYEQGFSPGLDATIFYPSVDLQFKNDTPSHILIQATATGTRMNINLYGTSDGRVAKVSTPKIISQTPALPELRQDDPTLPKGTVKQVDWAAAGAKVIFNRTVTRGNQTLINETVTSNYRPWQAVYLVGTKEG